MVIVDDIARTLEDAGFPIADRLTLPARAATYAAVPSGLAPALAQGLAETYPKGLYRHQAEALEASVDGHDVCLATATASANRSPRRSVSRRLPLVASPIDDAEQPSVSIHRAKAYR
jgi:DEAD/DEAH box helicase domain-containing protein